MMTAIRLEISPNKAVSGQAFAPARQCFAAQQDSARAQPLGRCPVRRGRLERGDAECHPVPDPKR